MLGGHNTTTRTDGAKLAGMTIQTSLLGAVIPIGWGRGRLSCNLIDYMAFTAVPHTTTDTTQSGGKGGSGGSSSTTSNTTYTYTASIMLGIAEGPITGINAVYKDSSSFTGVSALADSGLSVALGSYTQTPWPYLTSLFPSHALSYRGLAYVYAQDYDLGTLGGVANHSFEVDFTTQLGGGVHDADPKDVITDFLTNANYGVTGWKTGLLGSLTDYSNYCRANNLLLSPVLDTQIVASEFISRILDITHSDCAFTEAVLKIKPLGDASSTGNGVTWNPNLTPLFDLNESHFQSEVEQEIVDQSDAYNSVQAEYLDRANEYQPAITTSHDLDNIITFGERKQDVLTWHEICDADIARDAIQLWLQRVLYARDRFNFTLPQDFVWLEPLDFVTLTTVSDSLQLNRKLVRILSIEEDENGSDLLHFVAEGLPFTASKASYGGNSGGGYRPGTRDPPGSVQTPYIFNAPSSLTATGFEVWAAVCGTTAAWGGAYVWASFDGVNYTKIGNIPAPARYGLVYSATWPSAADPDSTTTLHVDLTTSAGKLSSFSSTQADRSTSLCMVGTELMSYTSASLTATSKYDITGYKRRGLFQTAVSSHPIGDPFVRLDSAIFKYAYLAEDLGKTLHVKFQSYNIHGRMLQDLSTCTDYTIVLAQGLVAPATPTSLALAGTGGTTWTGSQLSVVCDAMPRATSYKFDFYKSNGTTLVRSITTSVPEAIYLASMAVVDGAQRTYKIKATAMNAAGSSATSAFITVTDSAPATVTGVSATGGAFDGVVACTASSATDLAGYAVFYSNTSGFDPSTQGSVVRSGTPSLTIAGLPAGTYYCKIGAFDGWTSDPLQLNLSAQQSFVISTGGGSTPSGGGGSTGTGSGGFSGGGRVQSY